MHVSLPQHCQLLDKQSGYTLKGEEIIVPATAAAVVVVVHVVTVRGSKSILHAIFTMHV